MSHRKISYYFDFNFGNFLFSFGHPMKPMRINMVYELIKSYGLTNWINVKKGKSISYEELENFHHEEHLFNLSCEKNTKKIHKIETFFPKTNGEDCPIFLGLTEFVNLYTRSSLSAALELSKKNTGIAVNWSGGFHHAKNSEFSGFCYVNDIVISILELLKAFKKILYIDIDAHHGDGVEEAFYLSKRVLCLSFHNYQKFFFPESGCIENRGYRESRRYSLNFPVKSGLKDQSFHGIFRPIIDEILTTFSPDMIVLQAGADSLSKDPIGKFNLSIKGHGKCIEILKNTKLPFLILGGGGYKISNVSRCWTYETSLLLHKEVSNKIPYNIYWTKYKKSFKLNFKVSNNSDRNSKKNLLILRERIIRNVKKLKIRK